MSLMNKQGNGEYGSRQPQAGERRRFLTPPPPPNFLETRRGARKAALLCLFLFCIIAAPVQGQQSTSQSPMVLNTCGLPRYRVRLTSATVQKTFDMNSDCSPYGANTPGHFIDIVSGEFTINGNGHSIIAPGNFRIFRVSGTSAVLNLNNVVVWGGGTWIQNSPHRFMTVGTGATLNVRNSVFRGNVYEQVIYITGTGITANFENVIFRWNRSPRRHDERGSAMVIWGTNTVVTIDGGTFEDNGGQPAVIRIQAGTLRLRGRIKFSGNRDAVDSGGSLTGNPALSIGGIGIGRTGVTLDDAGAIYWSRDRKRKKEKSPTPTSTPRPLATTCIDLNQATGIAVSATYGLGSGIQCQRLGGGGIGIQSIVDAGFIDAVDVWGYVEQGVEVCFPQAGELLFLDARMIPRAIAPLSSTVVNGMTCGAIESPGSIVLMPLP